MPEKKLMIWSILAAVVASVTAVMAFKLMGVEGAGAAGGIGGGVGGAVAGALASKAKKSE